MSLNLALNSALSGLMTAQKGLDLVSHNISNVNTEGYTRKHFSPESRVLGGTGAGVQTGEISRRVEDGLLRDLRESQGTYGDLSTRQTYMERVQELFGTPADNNSMTHIINNLRTEFEVLGVETNSAPQADAVVQSGVQVANKLNAMSKQVQGLRGDADTAIQSYVNQINSILSNINVINDKITLADATQGGSPDLLDKRDVELTKLSELIDITYYARDGGAVSVFTKSGTTLVDSASRQVSHVGLSTVNPWDTASAGDIEGIMVGGNDITEEMRSGKIKGLVHMRDTELVNLQAQIDTLAKNLMESINQAHNRGTSYPSMSSTYTGSKTFVRTAEQSFSINDSNADSAIVLFNSDGTQKAQTTLRTLMTTDFSTTAKGGPPASSSETGPWTMQDYAAHLQSWMRNNGLSSAAVGFGDTDATTYTVNTDTTSSPVTDDGTNTTITGANGDYTGITAGMKVTIHNNGIATSHTVASVAGNGASIVLEGVRTITGGAGSDLDIVASAASGKMNVTLNDSRYGLSFRDQATTVVGSSAQDLPINFDSDGDGDQDETHAGLSNFLGLNDFYETKSNNWLWETKIQPTNYKQPGATTLTLMTADESYNITVSPGQSLETVAQRINDDSELQAKFSVKASVIKEGTGERLRLRNESGDEMVITGSNSDQFDNLGLARAATGQAASLKVDDQLTTQPDRLSKGSAQFDDTTGQFFLSAGDNSVALQLSAVMNESRSFASAGGLTTGDLTLGDYSATVISGAATRATAVEVEISYQKGLNQTLEMKNAEISAVNLDEELAQLMAFEQSYAAAAKVISTTKQLFEILNSIIR